MIKNNADIHDNNQFRVSNQPKPNLHVFGLWEEAGVPGGNPNQTGIGTENLWKRIK